AAARRPGTGAEEAGRRTHRRLGARPHRGQGGQGRGRRRYRGRRAARARGKAAAQMSAAETRRQVLYWRLLARLFDPEEQAALESGSMAIVGDLGLPAALLDPSVSIDTVVQRFPQLEAEFDGLMSDPGDDRDGEVRRAALVSKLLLNVFATGSG